MNQPQAPVRSVRSTRTLASSVASVTRRWLPFARSKPATSTAKPVAWALSLPDRGVIAVAASNPGRVRTAFNSVPRPPKTTGMTRSEAHWPSLAAKRQSRIGPSGNSTTLSRTRSRFTATGSGTEHSLLPAAGFAGSASQPAARSSAKHSIPSVGCSACRASGLGVFPLWASGV